MPSKLLRLAVLALAEASALSIPSVAQPPVQPAEAAQQARSTTISALPDAAADANIAARIRSIFQEIDGLEAVDSRVVAGVVTLDGSVPSGELAENAIAIASRVAGVVTVQDRMSRDLDLDTNLTPAVAQFRDDIRSWLRALPLIGVARELVALDRTERIHGRVGRHVGPFRLRRSRPDRHIGSARRHGLAGRRARRSRCHRHCAWLRRSRYRR